MIQFCGRTDVGRRRHRNEDSILVGDGILVVCDGIIHGTDFIYPAEREVADTVRTS